MFSLIQSFCQAIEQEFDLIATNRKKTLYTLAEFIKQQRKSKQIARIIAFVLRKIRMPEDQ